MHRRASTGLGNWRKCSIVSSQAPKRSNEHMSEDLRSKTVRAISHLGVGGALGKVISLGTTLLLARLLSPTDYGLMEIAMMIVGFVGFFNEIGMGSAIVQKAQLSAPEVNG